MADFRNTFRALTTHEPLRWQERLHAEFLRGVVRAACCLPTGVGKTLVIPIWLTALAAQGKRGSCPRLPRRLVYIVNRRTVVDQATNVVERLRARLEGQEDLDANASNCLRDLRRALAALAGSDGKLPLAVSTLRGELADNGEWKADPARPSIIIGTVDMIGSKLLFSGYGDGRYGRVHHAGLIGQDTFIAHDEAHLTPAFGRLLRQIAEVQRRDKSARPVRVMELSATIEPGDGQTNPDELFTLTEEDDADGVVRDRIRARKRLRLHSAADRKAVLGRIADIAGAYDAQNCRVLVYVRSPQDAKQVKEALCRHKGVDAERVQLLTGTLRGFERDRLVETDLFRWFAGGPASENTAYLVSTSAGEVGADLDADHMVCDLTTAESMVQRLGRVNRRGGRGRVALVDVVAEKSCVEADSKAPKRTPKWLVPYLRATVKALGELPRGRDGRRDASPAALRLLGGHTEARAPQPQVLPLTDILLDGWSLTALPQPLPGVPPVHDWLHGVQPAEPAETFIAWRKDLAELARAALPAQEVERVLAAFPIRSAERLREPVYRTQRELKKMARRAPGARALVVGRSVSWRGLDELAAQEARGLLRDAMLILPTGAGGLRDGYLDGGCQQEVTDVAEEAGQGQRRRQRVLIERGGERPVVEGEVQEGLLTRFRAVLADDEFDDAPEASGPLAIEYRVARAEANALMGAGEAIRPIGLAEHTEAVVRCAARIGACIGLAGEYAEALRLAARWHDCGKERAPWQRAAGNADPKRPVAKSGRRGLDWRALQGYRHEWGSLLEAACEPKIGDHAECDLILHLIAAHHGWARPHFEQRAQHPQFSSERNREASVQVMRSFARLQQRFGRWGLAWLESLLRCADAEASREDRP